MVAAKTAPKIERLAAGSRIGRYHLLQRLAVGGMAELYLACAEGLAGFQKVVVIKHVLPNLAADPAFVAMFLNEARIAATLTHPNIVHVTDIGEASGDYYYAMEFVHGRNVRELLREGSKVGGMPLDVALTIAIAAARALEHTHSACDVNGSALGLIHRDVSPANILVSYEGTAKLTDFGIAKASQKTQETVGGAIKGKVGYMSPEQCRGETLDQRSDLFALGVVLFEVTTGQRLFFGDSDFAILNKVLKGQTGRPSERIPNYPPALERITMRALASRREDRYATATEFRQDLEAFAHEARFRTTPAVVAAWMVARFGAPPAPRVELLQDAGAGAATPTLVVTAHTERVGVPAQAPAVAKVVATTPRGSGSGWGSLAGWAAAGALAALVGGGAVVWSQTRETSATGSAAADPRPSPAVTESVVPSAPRELAPDVVVVDPTSGAAPPAAELPAKADAEQSESSPPPLRARPVKKRMSPRKRARKKVRREGGKDMDNPFPVPL